MALSPYHERDSSVYRSRSSSFSSPTSRSFLYQEVFEIGGNQLVRSFSCGQVFAKDKTGQTIQATQLRISNFISPNKSLVKLNEENNGKSWTVPKKIPVNYHADQKPVKSRMSLKFEETEKPVTTVKTVARESKPEQISHIIWKNMKRTIYLNLAVLTIFSACYVYKYKYCNQQWDTQLIINKHREAVFGQDEAISKIESVLRRFSNPQENAVLCFTGSVGVGKTFVSSIIYNNFPWIPNKYIHIFDTNTEGTLRNKRYSSCGVNLIVIDGIGAVASDKAVKSVEHILDSNENAKFFVILIFRTHTTLEEEFVVKNIQNGRQNFYYIPFQDLRKEEIEQCFNVELKRQKKFVTEEKLKELLNEHTKFCNISRSFLGCKNVFHEVSLLPESD